MEHKINMRPSGIAWENEDAVFVTDSRVAYTSKGDVIKMKYDWNRDYIKSHATTPLSENFVVIPSGGYVLRGYDINIVDKEDESESYVSFVVMSLSAKLVREFKLCYGLEEPSSESERLHRRRIHDASDCVNLKDGKAIDNRSDVELRVYKDKTFAILIRITYDASTEKATERYFVIRPKFAPKASVYSYVDQLVRMEADASLEGKENTLIGNVAEVFDDSGVRKLSAKGLMNARTIFNFLYSCESCDMKDNTFPSSPYGMESRYSRTKFSKEFAEKVNGFFGIDAPENADVKAIFDTKHTSIDWRHSRTIGEGIASPEFLDRWISIKPTSAVAMKKRLEDDNDLWATLHWGNPEERRSIVWERREIGGNDFILVSYCVRSRRDRDVEKRAFIYDVKRRTRKVLIQDDKGCKSVIPALKNVILPYFRMTPDTEWDRTAREYVKVDDGPVQTIVGGLSVKELFAGTNVGWILDNEKEFGDDMYYLFPKSPNGPSGCYGEKYIGKIQEDIGEGIRIGVVALCVLATTGKAVMEQLLKSRMFRLYFLALYGEVAGQNGYFWDTSKKVVDRYDCCAFPYTSKGKNLKEMFGMSLNQLRMCDKAIEISRVRQERYDGSVGYSFKYLYPRIGRAAECLGVERLSALDDALFSKIIAMTKDDEFRGGDGWAPYGRDTVFDAALEYSYGRVPELLANNTPKERVAFLSAFKDHNQFSVMVDYLEMRESLKKRQDAAPEKDIFDEKEFPGKVGKSVKFIRFMPGMAVSSVYGGYRGHSFSYMGDTVDTEGDFVKYLKARYLPYATEKGSVQLEINEKGNIVGAIVKMNPIQHMGFLHEEMTAWYNLVCGRETVDGGKAAEFKEATKRVKKLVWSDPKTGLSIVAPKDVSDLRREGSVLSHCVASYVGPIIKGGHNIMFIRRSDMLDEPFYTLDVDDDGNVLEVHGYRNLEMGDDGIDQAYAETKREVYAKHSDIEGFLANWCKAMKGKVKKESIRRSYGRLEVVA